MASDSDSGFEDTTSSTDSILSSMYDFEQENDRTYHRYHPDIYLLPNDKVEQDRMDILHSKVLWPVFGERYFFAEIANPTSILDVGTGTGIWPIEVADSYPSARVVGTDLSPIQPVYVPPNVEFRIQNMKDPWRMRGRYDLVHTRNYHYSVTSWEEFYTKALDSLVPGGWVENQEFDWNLKSDDETVDKDGPTMKWCQLMNEGFVETGTSGRLDPETMKRQMEAIGFINCQIVRVKVPVGGWPKDEKLKLAGKWFLLSILGGIEGISVRLFTQVLGWSRDEMEILLAEVRKELKAKQVHGYCQYYVVYGQKPPCVAEPLP